MESWEQGWNGPGKPRETWAWAVLGSLVVHGLVVAVMLAVLQDKPAPRRVVVPVEAIALVPFKPGPAGGGGGRPAPVTRPEPVAPKSAPVCPQPKPQVKPKTPPKVKLAPPPTPEATTAPVIPTPAPPPALTRAKPPDTAAAGSQTGAPGAAAGTGQGGQGGGRGTGSGGGVGQGQGPGSGAGSALQGYLKEVRRLLEKHKDYPWMARRRNIQGVVAVVFTIGCGGQIMAARVSRSSGQDLLDEAAQNTIRRVGKLPPFPAELNRQQLTVEVPLAFRLSND
ncbi:MAG: TonB family protein [Deltaproteobacteria bacterium]|nr:TonB family protein [Deltaproteobacteria bacterium]